MASLTGPQKAYYDKLEQKVEEEKLQGNYKNYKRRGEKAMIYEWKPVYRRNKYRSRSLTLLQRAMELEVVTHCHVEVKITNRWKGKDGKNYSYKSSLPGVDDEPTTSSGPSTSSAAPLSVAAPAPAPETSDPQTSTPRKRRARGLDIDSNKCRACGGGNNDSSQAHWWIGCGAKIKGRCCTYWMHQKCAGIRCTTKKQLKTMPFYCPHHI